MLIDSIPWIMGHQWPSSKDQSVTLPVLLESISIAFPGLSILLPKGEGARHI